MNWNIFRAVEATEPTLTFNLKVGDNFKVTFGVGSNGGVSYRNLSCDLKWTLGLVQPIIIGGVISYQDGVVLAGTNVDTIVKDMTDYLTISKTLKSGFSVSDVGNVVIIDFEALEVGQGIVYVENLKAIDIVNELPVVYQTECNSAEFLVEEVVLPQPVGTVLFYLNITQ